LIFFLSKYRNRIPLMDQNRAIPEEKTKDWR
jgi:hypothetical protein